MVKRTKRNNYLSIFLILFGAFFVSLSTTHTVFRARSLKLDEKTVQAHLAVTSAIDPREQLIPTHIYSQYFLDVNIEPALYQNGHWTISPSAASYLVSSARPGESGNIILYGHNMRSILGNIRAYKGGEKIVLTLSNGALREYTVRSYVQVDPRDTHNLLPTAQETLTIYTCAGFLDSQRFVVTALPTI